MAFIKAIPPKMMHDKLGIYQGQWFPEMDRCWVDYDRGYSVTSRLIRHPKFGKIEHVSICRINGDHLPTTDGSSTISWQEKFQIKNELFGEDRFAIEVYPKTKYLIDQTDTYHLWVFDKVYNMPFGIHPREYQKAINRGYSMTQNELLKLQEIMDNT